MPSSWLMLIVFCGLLALCLTGAMAAIKHLGAGAFFVGLGIFVFVVVPILAVVLFTARVSYQQPRVSHAELSVEGHGLQPITISANRYEPPTTRRHLVSDAELIEEDGVLRIVKITEVEKAAREAELLASAAHEVVPPQPAHAPIPVEPAEHSKVASAEKGSVKKKSNEDEIKLGPTIVNEKARPEWVMKSHQTVGKVDRRVLTIGPYQTLQECREAIPGWLVDSTVTYLNEEQVVPFTITPDILASAGVSPGELRREVIQEEYAETIDGLSMGMMQQLHLSLRYTPDIRDELTRRLQDYQRRDRVNVVALLSGGILSLLGLTFGLLKVDTLTKGYYSKWLLLGVPAAIITGVGFASWLLVSVSSS